MKKVPEIFMNGVKRKPAPNPTNWQFQAIKANTRETKTSLPKRYSIKEKFPPVYNQTWGNCTSNAVLACDDYYYHGPKSKWVPSTVFTYYNQRKMEGSLNDPDEGSNVETALDAVRKYGACSNSVWPNYISFMKKPSPEAYENGLKGHEITKYYAIKSILQIKKALYSGYPVPCAMTWAFRAPDPESGMLNVPTDIEIKHCDLGHAVVIVSYDDILGAVEIRNSWGDTWGKRGYAWIKYEALKKVIWFDDTYAVVK